MDLQKHAKLALPLIVFVTLVAVSTLMVSTPAYCAAEEEEETVQSHENPMTRVNQKKDSARQELGKNQKLIINTGNGPGGEKPDPSYQQTRPAAPAQSLRPAAPAQQMRPADPRQLMRPAEPAQTMRPASPQQ